MNRRRYRIEANIRTLERFVSTIVKVTKTEAFIQRVTTNSTEEYYYVVLVADEQTHDHLKRNRFTDSMAMGRD